MAAAGAPSTATHIAPRWRSSAAQRNAKIAGIFARLFKPRRQAAYLVTCRACGAISTAILNIPSLCGAQGMVRPRHPPEKRGATGRPGRMSHGHHARDDHGGRPGTRMRPLTNDRPKPLVEGARQGADRSRHRPAGGGGREPDRRQSALSRRHAEGASRRAAATWRSAFPKRQTRCSAPAAASSRPCPISKASPSSCTIRIRSGSKASAMCSSA